MARHPSALERFVIDVAVDVRRHLDDAAELVGYVVAGYWLLVALIAGVEAFRPAGELLLNLSRSAR